MVTRRLRCFRTAPGAQAFLDSETEVAESDKDKILHIIRNIGFKVGHMANPSRGSDIISRQPTASPPDPAPRTSWQEQLCPSPMSSASSRMLTGDRRCFASNAGRTLAGAFVAGGRNRCRLIDASELQ